MLYECFIKNGLHCQDIEADSALEAKRLFVEMIVDNLDIDNVEANIWKMVKIQ